MSLKYNPLVRYGFDEVGATSGVASSPCDCEKVVPAKGEFFWDKDNLRRMNYVRWYEDNETTSVPGVLISALTLVDWVGFDNVETIPNSAFARPPFLYRGSFAKAKKIETSAFSGTSPYYINKEGYTNEQNLVMPVVDTIGYNAFSNSLSLMEASFPKATRVSMYAFRGCFRLGQLSLPECTWFEPTAIEGCTSLRSLSLPKWQWCANDSENICFRGCSTLHTVLMPSMVDLPQWSCLFKDCSRLSTVDMRSQRVVPDFCFANKPWLNKVDIASAITLGTGAFWNVGYLKSLNLPSVSKLEPFSIRNCVGLKNLTFGANITQFDYSNTVGSVSDCPVLTNIDVPDNWTIPAGGVSFPGCPNISPDTVKVMSAKLADNGGQATKRVGFDRRIKESVALAGTDLSVFEGKNYQLEFF